MHSTTWFAKCTWGMSYFLICLSFLIGGVLSYEQFAMNNEWRHMRGVGKNQMILGSHVDHRLLAMTRWIVYTCINKGSIYSIHMHFRLYCGDQ